MSEREKKVIAVGDFLKVTDTIVEFELQDPTSDIGEMVTVPIRIRRANPNETIKIMEFVNKRMGDSSVFTEGDLSKMSPDERTEAINLAYQYDATLISSCSFHPPADGVSLEQDPNPGKVFETADDVLEHCPLDLFDKLRVTIGRQRMVMTEAEAKK
jgi:hypothetical protein